MKLLLIIAICVPIAAGIGVLTATLPKPQLGLLISGSWTVNPYDDETSVEVFIPSSNRSCSLPPMPSGRWVHTMDGPYICGGHGGGGTARDCLQLSSGTWTSLYTPVRYRFNHCSWWTEGGQLVLIGGEASPRTTEVVPVHGGEGGLGFSLETNIVDACAITDRDTDTVIITGGLYTPSQISRYSMKGYESKLPNLLSGRRDHACGSFKRTDGTLVLLVAGGGDDHHSKYLQSTETLDIGHETWQFVAQLPWAVHGARAVTLDKNLFITGGRDNSFESGGRKADILQFDEAENSWKHAGMMLQARGDHAVTEIDLEGMMDYCT